MLQQLSEWLRDLSRQSRSAAHHARPRPGSHRARPALEPLEDRMCPTALSSLTQRYDAFRFIWNGGAPQTIANLRPGEFFHKGDLIHIEAYVGESLDPSVDPDGKGEAAEPGQIQLHVTSPGGLDHAWPSHQPISTFDYQPVKYDGEVLTAQIMGADSDEQAVMFIAVYAPSQPPSQPQRLSPQDKAALNHASARWNGIGALFTVGAGALAVLCGAPCTLGISLAGVGGGLSWLAGSYASDVVADDPPDANFHVIARPETLPVQRVRAGHGQLSLAGAAALNALFAAEAKEIGLEQAMITTLNRSSTAAAAGDLFDETYQLQALAHYSRDLAKMLRKEPALRARAMRALKAGHFRDVTITSQQVAAFQQSVAQQGLPPALVASLVQLGADSTILEQVRQSVLALDPNSISGSVLDSFMDPSLLGDEQAIASSLNVDTTPAGVQDVSLLVGVSRVKSGAHGPEVITIHNVSSQSLTGPLVLVFEKLTRAFNPHFLRPGVIRGQSPFVTVPVPGGVLQPGDSVSVAAVLKNVGHGGSRFTPSVLAS
jgi:hypothetical protein